MVSSCALEMSLAQEAYHFLFVQIFDLSTIAETLLFKKSLADYLRQSPMAGVHKDHINIVFPGVAAHHQITDL